MKDEIKIKVNEYWEKKFKALIEQISKNATARDGSNLREWAWRQIDDKRLN